MKKYIRIHSNKNIVVTAGLQCVDMTNPDAHVADRLNVKPAWVGTRTLIKVGTGYYPICLKDWDSVKQLAKDNVITIGEELDEVPAEYKNEVEEMANKINQALARYNNTKETVKKDKEHRLADKIEQVKKEAEGPKF